MQRLNESRAESLLLTLRSLASKTSKVHIAQQQFWDGEDRPRGTLRKTCDTGQVTFERASDETHSWITVSFGAMSFEVFGDGSIPSHMNPATYYEVTGQTVHFEMRAGNPHLKTSLTFS